MSSIAEQVGRVVGRRYRLLLPVGSGASSQVFAAVDARLGRRVAVKVLHPMLAGDAAFLRRFRAEARLAASLDHPHVMRVFDWGEDEGGPYLVLEFLGGGSLRSLLDSGSTLSEEQVAHIGWQAASGLAYAHRRGIVHRDIKPGNLLFDDEGNLRIADFGVARALAEAALTEPLGAIFGTARYASPEQAEGRPLDDRTDVYSLALVLYEALTGRVPFTRDTVSATLMARVGATLPPIRELGSLAPIIAQAAISEPLARLDARAVALDLELLCRELPAPGPLPLEHVRLEGNASRLRDRDPTDVDARSAGTAEAPAAEAPGSAEAPGFAAVGQLDRSGVPPDRPDDLTIVPATAVIAAVEPEEPRTRPGRRRRRWAKILAIVVAALLVAGGTTAAVLRFGVYDHSVPKVTAFPVGLAEHDLRAAGLTMRIAGDRYSLSVPNGDVISQSLPPGRLEKAGTIVKVVVSRGPAPVPVPNLTNDSIAKVRSALFAGHLRVKFAPSQYSETVPAGRVITWTPRRGPQPRDSTVTVTISKGPHPRVIPDVGHGSYAGAASALDALKLVPKAVYEHSSQWPDGDVISTFPAAGLTVRRGALVDVYVSLGPRLTTVPSIGPGDSVSSAVAALKHADLVPELYGPGNIVFAISDQPGQRVPVGSTVYVYSI